MAGASGTFEGRFGSVLVADDDDTILSAFRRALPRYGVDVLTANSRVSARQLASKHRPRAAIVDLRLGSDSGLELLRDLRRQSAEIELILITGYGSIASAVEAIKLGALDVVPKPFTVAELMERLAPRRPVASSAIVTPSAERALWEHVHRVLADCGGNKSEASRRLHKPRSWLRRFLARCAPVK